MGFTVKKQNEFFISVAKEGIHSFMILGVIDNNGSPKTLARVGKTNDVDSDVYNTLKITAKVATIGSLARIKDEGVYDSDEEITYTAYSINYEQMKEFLGLIAEIEKKQLANPLIAESIINNYIARYAQNLSKEQARKPALDSQAIKTYVPIEKADSDEITFELKKLKECEFLTADEKKSGPLVQDAQQIQISNTCRSSALNIVEAVLGFAPNISKHFFISPDYTTKMAAGSPDKQSFYILPPPPSVKKKEFSDAQYKALEKIYKRLEEIPKLKAHDQETRDKFDALKQSYNAIFGENKLSATALLTKITEHVAKNQKALFEKRAPGIVSKALGTKSSTEKMIDDIKKELEGLKEKDSPSADSPSLK